MRVKPLIAVPLIAIALAGCSTQQPTQETSTSVAQEQPLFSSDEEALAAAQAAYANYLEVSDQIARDGGANPERLKGLVSESMYQSEKATLDSFVEKQIVMNGQTTFDSSHVQEVTQNSVSIYLCLDTSSAGLSSNSETVNQATASRWPLIVTMSKSGSGNLVLADSQTWSGTNFC